MGTTNKLGFPVEVCARCIGSGVHSYNDIEGDACRQCGGGGYTIVQEAKAAWNAYLQASRKAKECSACDLAVGDLVAVGGQWRAIEAVAITPAVKGRSRVPGGEMVPSVFGAVLTIGGETIATTTANLYKRKPGTVDPRPFLDMVPKPVAHK